MNKLLFCISILLASHICQAQSFLALGNSAYEQGKYKEAARWFDWAIKADSTDAVAYLNRGQAKRALQLHQDALEDFKRVVELLPNDGNAHFWLALSAFHAGDMNLSLESNSKAIEIGNDFFSQSLLNRAQTYIRLGKQKQAFTDLDSVIKLADHNLMNAHFDRAQLHMRLDDKRAALTDYKRVVELNPKNVQLTWDIGRVSYEIEEYADALTFYSRAIDRIEKPDAQLFLIRGEVFEKLTQYDAAIDEYTRVIDMDPQMSHAYYSRGQAKARKGDIDGACADWRKASQLGYKEVNDTIVYNCN